jgi:ectoine hydroxylase-related dioxygenase (phytanoyl-CoA dioxygenase family)
MISDAQLGEYRETGCLVVADVLSAEELRSVRDAVDTLVEASRGAKRNDALYDLEDDHSPDTPRVRRLKSPDRHHLAFARLRAHAKVVEILGQLWGTGVRFDKAKLNMKDAGGGAPVEWHQDWAFYPHTNDDLAAVGFMLDDMTEDNGPLMVVPGSHTGPVFDHHVDGHFCGGIDVQTQGVDLTRAITLTGRAGSVTIHHVRALHGSARNRSGAPRRLLLHQYCAADAWPVGEHLGYDDYLAGLVAGEPTLEPRMTAVPVRLPLPPAPNQGSIYENQRTLGGRYFA